MGYAIVREEEKKAATREEEEEGSLQLKRADGWAVSSRLGGNGSIRRQV
jgi:hypothetical protein